MEPSEQPDSQSLCYRFGEFRLDPARRLLFGTNGERIALKPKVFDTLHHFVQHPGRPLDKAALIKSIWRDVVVDENGLNQHVSTLRRVLGERPGENRFIATIPGRGYCFVADVTPPLVPGVQGESWRYVRSALQIQSPGDREIVLMRIVATGRERAFETWTEPELLRRWYALPGWSMVVCELELKPGGAMRFVTRHADGTEVSQRGVIREVARPERLIHTEHWDNPYFREVLVTTSFIVADESTVLNVRVRHPTKQGRDRFLESGLIRDIELLYDRFARLAETGSL